MLSGIQKLLINQSCWRSPKSPSPSSCWRPQPSRQATLTIPSSAPPSPPRLATTGEPCRREEKERRRGKGGKLLLINKNLCLAFQESGWALSVADRGEPKRQGGQYFVWGGLTSLQIMWSLMEYHLNTRFLFIKDHYQQEIQHAAGVLDVNAFEWKVLNEVSRQLKSEMNIFQHIPREGKSQNLDDWYSLELPFLTPAVFHPVSGCSSYLPSPTHTSTTMPRSTTTLTSTPSQASAFTLAGALIKMEFWK